MLRQQHRNTTAQQNTHHHGKQTQRISHHGGNINAHTADHKEQRNHEGKTNHLKAVSYHMQSRRRGQRTQNQARRKGAQHRIQIKKGSTHDQGRQQEHRKTQNRLTGRIRLRGHNLTQTRHMRKQTVRNQRRNNRNHHKCQQHHKRHARRTRRQQQ